MIGSEVWKQIPGYENYEVSNTGKVRNRNFNRTGTVKEMTPKRSRGYKSVQLFRDGEGRYFTVHYLVALLFLDNPRGCTEVNHIDGDILNNDVSNLEWCTRAENLAHAVKNNLENRHRRAIVVTFPDGLEMEFESTAEASRKIGVSKPSILRGLKGECKSSKGFAFRYKDL